MELGLIYMNARYYVPALGRFASADTLVPDPTNPQQFNRFSYVLNTPLRFTDPTGHLSQDEIKEYFGYENKQQMRDDEWDEELINLLWSDDLTWASVFSFFTEDGGQVEAMLVLMQYGPDTFSGGFWGMSGSMEGRPVGKYQIKQVDAFTDEAQLLSRRYSNTWALNSPPIHEDFSFYRYTKYSDWGAEGLSRGLTYVGGGIAIAGLLLEPTGLGKAGLAVASAGTGISIAGFAMQLSVDIGFVEPTKYYPILHVTPIEFRHGGLGLDNPPGFYAPQ